MFRYQIHPGEGGGDAALFAVEFGDAVVRHVGGHAEMSGRVVELESPVRL